MSKQRKRSNTNTKGRKKYDDTQYLRLDHKMLGSPQFRSLNGNDARILLEICLRHNGFNNGRIGAGYEDLAQKLMLGKSTIQRALKRLQKTGFIKLRKKGKFMGRIASEWEVTFLQREGYRPTNEWGQAKALKNKRKPKLKSLEEE